MTVAERPLETGWLPDTPVDDTVLRRFLHNQVDVNELFAHARGGRVEHLDGASLVSAGPVTPFLNQALLTRPLSGPDDPVLDAVAGFYTGSAGLLVSLWPTPDLAARGWHPVGHPVFVVRAPAPVSEDLLHREGVTVTDVTTPDELRTYDRVLHDGYPAPPPTDGRPTVADGVLGTGLRLRLASVDGTPAAAAAGYVGAGIVNLCTAATLPPARRRGAWASLVWHRVADAPSLPAVAFTSDDSRPGFLRMGFLPICRFTLWLVGG